MPQSSVNNSPLLTSSFAPGDVTVLLEAGDVELVSIERKEALLRSGRSYGTLLTPESAPSAWQHDTFEAALTRNGEQIGALLSRLSATLLNAYPDAVYVSLARAGTPIGCVLRRLAWRAGRDVAHYAVSIIRGEGLDTQALKIIQDKHPASTLIFVDGWSGKGAIAATLRASLPPGLPWTLATVCDPAGVADYAATYADLLLPHAALNATVSGLLSRTFTRGQGQLHGARLEEDLGLHDVSAEYVERLVELAVSTNGFPVSAGPRPIAPAQTAMALASELGIANPNLVKPSVGEATRVFLRRRPQHLLLREDHPDTRHLLLLAHQRGVAVTFHPELPYLAAAIIHPGES